MAAKQQAIRPKRGEVYLVSFDPTVGAEIKKTRPALIIQNDIGNLHSPLTIVAAISSKMDDELFPTEVLIRASEGGLDRDCVAKLDQIRSIDKARLGKRLGALKPDTMARVKRAIEISLGLVNL